MNNINSDVKTDTVSKKNILAYGMGGLASTMPNQFKAQFSMSFLTDIAGIPIKTVGIISMVISIWDAINDPLIGQIVDKTNTKKWGKYRPHMMIGAIGLAITLVMSFCVPNISLNNKIIYYLVVTAMLSVFFTQFTVPWQALNSIISKDSHQRNLLLACRQLTGAIATSAVGLFVIPMVSSFATPDIGWVFTALFIGVVLVVSAFISANSAAQNDYYGSIPTPPKVKIMDQLNIFLKNAAVICVSLMLGAVNLGITINAAISIYYLRYVVQSIKLLSVVSAIQICINFIVIPMLPAIIKKFGKIKVLYAGMGIQLLGAIILFILREQAQIYQVIIISALSSTGLALANICCFSLIPDCTDYTEKRFGHANAGFINAVSTFVRKLFGSFSTLIVGNFLALAGYVANQAIPQSCVDMIINIKVVIPIFTFIFIVIIASIYTRKTKNPMIRQK